MENNIFRVNQALTDSVIQAAMQTDPSDVSFTSGMAGNGKLTVHWTRQRFSDPLDRQQRNWASTLPLGLYQLCFLFTD